MRDLGIKVHTALALGVPNLSRVLAYRLALRLGIHPVQRLRAARPEGPFFRPPETLGRDGPAPTRWVNDAWYFGWLRVPLEGRPPHWHRNPFTDTDVDGMDQPWWRIPDFGSGGGDIKAVWEPSRFDWVLAHALRARAGDGQAVDRLNAWLADWCHGNPPYSGPNWKCGQEAAIRVLHLAVTAILLQQWSSPEHGLLELVRVHLTRIAPTMQYAIAQDNNHGTSEAAALFVGGSWLQRVSDNRQAAKWARTGRRWLENRAQRLVAKDGSFSQYSVNYHRLLLETLSVAELWRRRIEVPRFSPTFTARCQAATHWMYAFTDAQSGDAPNLGANDGAHLLPIGAASYCDYRPAVQLAAALFLDSAAYPEGAWNETLRALEIPVPEGRMPTTRTQYFDKGGYALLCLSEARAYFRYPRYRFRPSHADALHLDLWLGSANVLRDGGSYSYAAEGRWYDYFSGTASHNTVQFDDRDQMPRLGRFLYGAWLETSYLSPPRQEGEGQAFSAAYRDWTGAEHRREVVLAPTRLEVTDRVSGFRRKAVLRWRLAPGKWQYSNGAWRCGALALRVHADMPLTRMELVEGWESRYYLKCDPLPVLEAESADEGCFHTELTWCDEREG